MKKIKLYFLSLFVIAGIVSCEEDSDTLTGNERTGGLVEVESQLVGYVVGNGNDKKYTAKFSINQTEEDFTSKIDVYKVFTNIDGKTSNEVLLTTLDVPVAPGVQKVSFDFSFNELIKDLKVDGLPISSDDGLLNIGDAWTLKFLSHTSRGYKNLNAATAKVAVGTRFAGKYKVILADSKYWRIGVLTQSAWTGDLIRIVESVDATTYKLVEYAGPFAGPTNTHYFKIDGSGTVNTPVLYKGSTQLLNGWPLINCTESASNMLNACAVSGPQNVVVKDDVAGKDRIYRSYGYLTGSGSVGPREVYEVLEKVVE
ncbi:hypothetical protein [Flavobacterium sp. TSSA_36]|uniref:hypothetical protein n=1 Tax=Flavobacterium sp. TSSA_36 TaxID=3447669 RepID=UPI003F37ADA6